MKTALYVATVARTYRLAIDDFYRRPGELYKSRIPFYKIRDKQMYLQTVYNRFLLWKAR